MNAKKCVEALCQEYPGMTPYLYTSYDGKYYFSICETGTPKEERILDFHSVDPVSLKVSGNIPTMSLLTNSKFVEALKNAKPIVFQDETHIEHHGIKGQKWGVMNGPPYPLNKKTHDRVVNDTQQIKKEGNLAAVAAIGIGLAVEALTYKAVESAVINAHHKRTKQQINSHDEHLEKVADTKHLYTKDSPPKQTIGKHSAADDLKKVNPLYDENVANTTNNCVLCTMTYDMRRRGYDVTSRLSAEPLQSLRFFKEVYQPPPKQDNYSNNRTFEDVEYSILKKNPEGSRGELGVGGYKNGMWFGHAMAFEVNNGKLTILDAQTNQKYSSFKDMKASNEGQSTILDIIQPEYTTTIRLDDKGVNIPALNSVCADYKDFIKHTDAGKDCLAHFGIKGQKWGVRRFQNEDGTLTPEGIERYRKKMTKTQYKEFLSKNPRVQKDVLRYLDRNEKFDTAMTKSEAANSAVGRAARPIKIAVQAAGVAYLASVAGIAVVTIASLLTKNMKKQSQDFINKNSSYKMNAIPVYDYSIR